MLDSRRWLTDVCGPIIYVTQDPDVYVPDSPYYPEIEADFVSMFTAVSDSSPRDRHYYPNFTVQSIDVMKTHLISPLYYNLTLTAYSQLYPELQASYPARSELSATLPESLEEWTIDFQVKDPCLSASFEQKLFYLTSTDASQEVTNYVEEKKESDSTE